MTHTGERRSRGAIQLAVSLALAGAVGCSAPQTAGDAGLSMDAGTQGLLDSGPSDAGHGDSGTPQGLDAGPRDSGVSPATDAGPPDSGWTDAGPGLSSDGGAGGIVGAQVGVGTTVAGCQIFPNDNPWNVQVDGINVPITHAYDTELPQGAEAHPDFGDYSTNHYGIPFSVVDGGQPDVATTFTLWADQSDPGPGGWVGANPVTTSAAMGTTAYPYFLGMHIEGDPAPGGTPGNLPNDQHALVLQQGPQGCMSYEAWNCVVSSSLPILCANGAVFDLTSNALRPAGWTSGDLAGMSILAGLVKYDEVLAGAVTHAIRVTFENTQSGYIPPATHAVSPGHGAGPVGSAYPPMGLRIRLKSSVVLSPHLTQSLTIMNAMKKYGLIVADIGGNWFFQGDSDDRWSALAPDGNDTIIDEMTDDFRHLNGSDFEVIDTGTPVDTDL